MVPFVGLAIGTVSGVYDLVNGNIAFGLLNIGQGIVSTIPGVGTALSIGMGVAIGAARIATTVSNIKT